MPALPVSPPGPYSLAAAKPWAPRGTRRGARPLPLGRPRGRRQPAAVPPALPDATPGPFPCPCRRDEPRSQHQRNREGRRGEAASPRCPQGRAISLRTGTKCHPSPVRGRGINPDPDKFPAQGRARRHRPPGTETRRERLSTAGARREETGSEDEFRGDYCYYKPPLGDL